jgi:polyhydroxyalkanoate synthesis regulator phasin
MMKIQMKKVGVIVGAALVGVLTFSAISFAQTPDTSGGNTPLMERVQQGIQNGLQNGFQRGGPGGRGGMGGPGAFGEERGMRGGDNHEELAAALGMTEDELHTAIQGGQTIEEIATEKGVDLQAFFLEQAQEHLTQAVTDGKLTQEEADARLAEIQTAIENGEFPGHRGPGGFGDEMGMGMRGGERDGALAEALGMTQDELHTAIQGGQTIEEIATEKGVDLQAFFLEQAKENLTQAVTDGKLTQEEADARLAEIQTAIENGEFPGHHGPRGSHEFGMGGPMGERDGDLAAALGMTQDELHTAIQGGQTIEEIATEKGVDLQAFFLEQAQEHLTQAVTDGKLTQEEADARLAEIQTAIENGEFPGHRGPGMGDFGPRGEQGGRGQQGGRGGQGGRHNR